MTDAFEINGSMYIIIEYIEGKNLRQLIEARGRLDEIEALEITLQVLEVTDYMNSLKPNPIIHGDIKPGNVIHSKGKTVLIDLGSVDTDESTAGFCAPERFSGKAKSIESDIYSIGELLHYLVCGEVKKIYSKKRNGEISNDIYKIIDKSTKKLPHDRYGSFADMMAQVQRLIKLRTAGITKENRLKAICIPGCAEAACEMGYSLEGMNLNVLVADLDMLSPYVHSVMGVDKYRHCLQDYADGDPNDLISKCTNIKKSSLWMLPCRLDYENFEHFGDNLLPLLISGASGFFDVLVISCSGFPYDKFFIDSLIYCDSAVFPVRKGIVDIRKYNAMVSFMNNRQNIPVDKMIFMGINNNGSNLGQLIAAGAVETSWVGSIPYNPLVETFYATGNPYLFSLKNKYYEKYIKILKKAGVIG